MFQTILVDKTEAHILSLLTIFIFENFAVYGIMWKSIVQRGRPEMAIWRMRIARCITKARITYAHNM